MPVPAKLFVGSMDVAHSASAYCRILIMHMCLIRATETAVRT